jgi:mono/diheme cytochrome c family protein
MRPKKLRVAVGDLSRAAGRLSLVLTAVVLAFAAAPLVIATLCPDLQAHSRTTAVTYTGDVEPILQRRCGQCHTANGPGHLPLETFEQARTWSRAIREQVLERRMPPWPAATGFSDYRNDRSLTPTEIELLASWADGGAPRGDPAVASVRRNVAGTPTERAIVVSLPADRPESQTQRFSLPTEVDADTWISGWEVRPASPAVIQQVVASIGTAPLGSWVPGEGRIRFPDGVAQSLRHGARLSVEIHYTKSAASEPAGGSIVLYEGPAGTPIERLTLGCAPKTLTHDAFAIAVTPQAPADESVEVAARRPDGTVQPLCVILQSMPAYPASYRFAKPIALRRGTMIDIRSSSPQCSATLEITSRRPGRAAAP